MIKTIILEERSIYWRLLIVFHSGYQLSILFSKDAGMIQHIVALTHAVEQLLLNLQSGG